MRDSAKSPGNLITNKAKEENKTELELDIGATVAD